MKFRLNMELLDESMKTVVDISPTKQAIIDHYQKVIGTVPQDVQVKYYAQDSRINWTTFIVTSSNGVLGFTDGPIE